MASRKRSSGSHSPLHFQWNAKLILLTGPKEDERTIREGFERKLRVALHKACPRWFGANTTKPEEIAFQIAWGARFIPHPTKTRVIVDDLRVDYSNRPGDLRPWIRITEAVPDRRKALPRLPVSSWDRLTQIDGKTPREATDILKDKAVTAHKAARAKKAEATGSSPTPPQKPSKPSTGRTHGTKKRR